MRDLLLIILANGLVNNVVLSRFLGLCSFMGVSNKVSSAIGMAMATTFVLTMATGVGWIIEHAVLVPLGLEYLRLLSFIMVIASLVQLTELFIAKQSPELHRTLGIFLPLITTNCAAAMSARPRPRRPPMRVSVLVISPLPFTPAHSECRGMT